MESGSDARQNGVFGRFGNDRNVGGAVVAVVRVFGRAPPARRTAERELAKGIPPFPLVAVGVVKGVGVPYFR